MSKWVGVEMSDHLSKLVPGEKAKGVWEKKRKRRKLARASARKNR